MATYKVPQDVEAEDKLLGPLTFKQFIFFLVAAGAGLVAWLLFQIHPVLVLIPVPIILIFGGLAIFRREDQPVERYLLSFFNFLIRPRQRVWNTEGYYEHLVITRRQKEEPTPLKRDVKQVHGQLEKLAQTVDTRGWSTKRPELSVPNTTASVGSQNDDRLFIPDQTQEPAEVHEREDMMSEENPEGMQLDNLLHEQTRQRREQVMENVRKQAQGQTVSNSQSAPQINEQTSQNNVAAHDQQTRNDSDANTATGNQSSSQSAQQNGDYYTYTDQTTNATQQSGILDMSNELSVSQIAAVANRKSDDEVQEGEEVQLR